MGKPEPFRQRPSVAFHAIKRLKQTRNENRPLVSSYFVSRGYFWRNETL